jgi:hypothetical protein
MQDTSKIKERIISIIQQNGPSLPSNIARELDLSILFASAFLSELLSQKKLKISNLRVGNSPVYFIPGQEPKLENFSEHLKSKEREAFLLLRENKFLKDEEQQPAIRVALRAIKDFAIPFENNGVFFWRYFVVPESEFDNEEDPIEETKEIEKIEEGPETEEIEEDEEDVPEKKKIVKRKPSKKKNDKFFNQVKEFLAEKSIDILDIEGVSQKDLMLRISDNGEEKLLVAYNKKRIGEDEIIRANKKAEEIGLDYIILSLGGPLKKLQNLIKAIKNLSKIEKLE